MPSNQRPSNSAEATALVAEADIDFLPNDDPVVATVGTNIDNREQYIAVNCLASEKIDWTTFSGCSGKDRPNLITQCRFGLNSAIAQRGFNCRLI